MIVITKDILDQIRVKQVRITLTDKVIAFSLLDFVNYVLINCCWFLKCFEMIKKDQILQRLF